jgi:hypothetical protein
MCLPLEWTAVQAAGEAAPEEDGGAAGWRSGTPSRGAPPSSLEGRELHLRQRQEQRPAMAAPGRRAVAGRPWRHLDLHEIRFVSLLCLSYHFPLNIWHPKSKIRDPCEDFSI